MTVTEQWAVWLHDNSAIALVAIPALAFMEALVGLGLLISGAVLLSVCTMIYLQGLATLWQILPLAFCGALLADHLGFYLGRHLGPSLLQLGVVRRRQRHVDRAQELLHRYGGAAVIVGRLLTMVRSVVPAIIGTSGMSRLRFTCFDIAACLVWTAGLGLLVTGFDALAA